MESQSQITRAFDQAITSYFSEQLPKMLMERKDIDKKNLKICIEIKSSKSQLEKRIIKRVKKLKRLEAGIIQTSRKAAKARQDAIKYRNEAVKILNKAKLISDKSEEMMDRSQNIQNEVVKMMDNIKNQILNQEE